jgi:hypothetical protein
MADRKTQDSNVVGTRYAEEESYGVLPASPVWNTLEPDSFGDWGGEVTLMPRNPINASRQRQKGVVVDVAAGGSLTQDLTFENLQDLAQYAFCAALRKKDEVTVTAAATGPDAFTVASGGTGYREGDIMFVTDGPNKGRHVVSAGSTGTNVPVASTLVVESGVEHLAYRVGHRFASGDAEIDVSGDWPRLVAGSKDLTELGLMDGEFVGVGSDTEANRFALAANVFIGRLRASGAAFLEFAKTTRQPEADNGSGKAIEVFFMSKLVKNESDPALIIDKSAHLERILGAPDTSEPGQTQAQYLRGSMLNELSISIQQSNKITVEMSWVSADELLRAAGAGGDNGPLAGDRPALVKSAAFNTSRDIIHMKMAPVVEGEPVPDPLFAFLENMTITLTNNMTVDKAVGVLGGFAVTKGEFAVGAQVTAYFTRVEAIKMVQDNVDVTLSGHWIRQNRGMSFDMPLVSSGGGRANVEKNQAIRLDLGVDAAEGADLDHTLLMGWWDYIPSVFDN